MRRDDDLTKALHRWGYAQAHRFAHPANDEGRDHPLDRARDFAPGTRDAAIRQLIGRGGEARRALMARGTGIESLRMLPEWACDPIKAKDDSGGGPWISEAVVDIGTPDELRWVDRALAQLSRQYPIRAIVVRVEFTERGSQGRKCHIIEERWGAKLTVRQYRYELSKALDWMDGRAAA